MSGEFYSLPQVEPISTDELLVIRDRAGQRATLASLKQTLGGSAISLSETPPKQGHLWLQANADGQVIERWHSRPGGLWVSDLSWSVHEFRAAVNHSRLFTKPNPCPAAQIWVESFMVRGRLQDGFKGRGDRWDFKLNFANSQRREIAFWALSLEEGDRGDTFHLSEPVGQVVAQDDCLGLWLRAQRSGKPPHLQLLTLGTVLRKVYHAPPNNG